MLAVRCITCGDVNHSIDVGTEPVMVDGEVQLKGIIGYVDCGHLTMCSHLTYRAVLIKNNLENGCLSVEDLWQLGFADHRDEEEE